MNTIIDFFFNYILIPFTCLLLLGLIIGLPIMIYQEYTAPKFYLRKDEFTCSMAHKETAMIPISTGKTTIYVPQTSTICDQYTRNGVQK